MNRNSEEIKYSNVFLIRMGKKEREGEREIANSVKGRCLKSRILAHSLFK